MNLGLYDPDDTYSTESRVSIENVFFSWNDAPEGITNSINTVIGRGRIPILTLEPWPLNKDDTPDQFLQSVIAGNFDQTIRSVCEVVGSSGDTIFIRWGHEMELKTVRYPWAGSNPDLYIQAYQHFVNSCRAVSPSIRYIWSPAGDKGLEKYWPGENFVDYIGLSVFSYDEWEKENIGRQRSFHEILAGKYNRVVKYKKPIIVAELGVTGSEKHKFDWLKAARQSFRSFSNLKAVVYFNKIDSEGVWGPNLQPPDWSVTPNSLTPILETITLPVSKTL